MRKAAVIGGGAAGMMTAVLADGEKTEIHLYEKNEKLGKKLFITGKGRCNVTNDCPTEEFFTNVVTNPKFLYSSAYSFDSAQVQEFFEAAGVRLKVERGNRVFPESDHSSDIIRALETELKRKNVQVHKNTKVKELLFEGDRVKGIRLENGKELFYNDVVVATGVCRTRRRGRMETATVSQKRQDLPSLRSARRWCRWKQRKRTSVSCRDSP